MIAWLLISFFVLLFLGVPIAMSLGLSAMGGILFLGGGSTVTIAQRMFEGMNSFALLAIPLYTFAGFTMSKGGISKRLMDFCYSIVGHIYGGLAHVNVLSSKGKPWLFVFRSHLHALIQNHLNELKAHCSGHKGK